MPSPGYFDALLYPELGRGAEDLLFGTQTDLLARAIDTLKSRERVILSLVYFEELNTDEVALALNLSSDDVVAICHHAMAQVSAAMDRATSDHLAQADLEAAPNGLRATVQKWTA